MVTGAQQHSAQAAFTEQLIEPEQPEYTRFSEPALQTRQPPSWPRPASFRQSPQFEVAAIASGVSVAGGGA
jgi:hypothetical protein